MNFRTRLSLIIFFLGISIASWAELRWIEVGINGMTCSACSRSVDMSIRRLDFVDSVVMSLEKTEARIYVKQSQPINFKAIAGAVKDAGFSVDFVKLNFNLNDVPIDGEGIFSFQGQQFQCIQPDHLTASDAVVFKLVDEGFLPRSESTQWKKKIKAAHAAAGTKVMHVVREI